MYCRVFACDFDGTGATGGQLAPELAAALSTARVHGYVTLLVTGRVHEDVEALCGDLSMFDAVVAENGAVVCLPAAQRTIQLGHPPAVAFLGAMRARGIAFQVGSVVVGTWEHHARELLDLVRQFAIDGQLVFNRDALMLLPSGINKAVGVRQALVELRRSEHNMVAFGDAENDLPLFAASAYAVAARGARPEVVARADEQLKRPGGAGVAQFIYRVIEAGGYLPTAARSRVPIGLDGRGKPVTLPESGTSVMVTGDPRSGKSWLAGMLAEQLLDRGCRLCVIDPEGDYLSLGQRPHVVLFGTDLGLPEPSTVHQLLRDEPVSLVLGLTSLPQPAQVTYVNAVLGQLADCSAATGLPHWVVVDEAQYFFHDPVSPPVRLVPTTNYLFATYRPSLVSNEVFGVVRAHLVTHTAVEEERYFITSLLRTRGPADVVVADALQELDGRHAGLLIEDDAAPTWTVFVPGQRLTSHAHHARKYADTWLPEHRAFHFMLTNAAGPVVAHNVLEFHSAVQSVPLASLRHHLANGDFSRWAADILGDEVLARGLRKLERATESGAPPDRAEILAHIADQYMLSNDE